MLLKQIAIISLSLLLFTKELITPIPQGIDYDMKKALLGKKLFFETKLSADNTLSCASCHIIKNGGDDDIKFSIGINGQRGNINSPTVLNTRYNFRQFWNGRASSLKIQAVGPIHNPKEMGSNFNQVILKLKKEAYYQKQFLIVFKDGITKDNIVDAIVEFEKALTTPNSRFDKYLRGDKFALSSIELEGFNLFKSLGCISCHNGVNIGGNLYQKIGILEKYQTTNKNLGLYDVTGDEEDKNYFKVPTLRNISKSAPYFHDGGAKNLTDAIEIMIRLQLGRIPKRDDVIKLEKFLRTLDGEDPIIMGKQ